MIVDKSVSIGFKQQQKEVLTVQPKGRKIKISGKHSMFGERKMKIH